MAKAYVGTSGFTYAHWGGGVFYPDDLPQSKWLEYYSQYFSTVEINASFYHLPKHTVFENWHKRTPKDFVFAVKGSRFITHIKKLTNCAEPLERFFSSAAGLAEKLHVVLWQLPPGLKAEVKRLEDFLKLLRGHPVGRLVRHTLEFRHTSWFKPEIYRILEKYKVALSIAHSDRYPREEVVTAPFVYLRFHGGQALYASNYSDRELRDWAKKCQVWLSQGRDIYAYFNNDAAGFAVDNAKTLKQFIERTSKQLPLAPSSK